MNSEIDHLRNLWKKSKWYSEKGEKKVTEQYDEIHSRINKKESPEVYCENIRKACKNIIEAFEDIKQVEIVIEENSKD